MSDIHIEEVQTDLEITESVGTLAPAEVKRLVALVMEQLKAKERHEERRKRDDQLRNTAYVSDLTE
jgi:hypothetical protein